MQFHKINLKSITRETKSTVSFSVNVPPHLKEAYSYTAGQYLPIKLFVGGKAVTRYYSFSSSPLQEDLQFTVKKVQDGLVSSFINDKLTVETPMAFGEPQGEFILQNPGSANTYMAIAGGSGITPIISMIRQELFTNLDSKFVLIYANSSVEETIFLEELQELQRKFPTRLYIEFFFKQDAIQGSNAGRVEASHIESFIKEKYAHFAFNSYYICGPKALNDFAIETLVALGINRENIFFELFFIGDLPDTNLGDDKEIEVYMPETEKRIKVEGKKSLLEELLEQGIEVEHSCKSGLCKSCLCEISKGAVDVTENFILTDEEIKVNYRLLCLAKPKSEALEIKF
jgi:ring-1,2-phenylacetyl-CoA epoxidase subunit PaaE